MLPSFSFLFSLKVSEVCVSLPLISPLQCCPLEMKHWIWRRQKEKFMEDIKKNNNRFVQSHYCVVRRNLVSSTNSLPIPNELLIQDLCFQYLPRIFAKRLMSLALSFFLFERRLHFHGSPVSPSRIQGEPEVFRRKLSWVAFNLDWDVCSCRRFEIKV